MPGAEGANMDKPVIFLCDHQPEGRQQAEQELTRRYADDYEIVSEATPAAALERLAAQGAADREVSIVLCSQYPPGMSGTDFLGRVHDVLPEAKRALLIDLGDISCAGTLLEALTFHQADDYITRPFSSPDETFYRAVTDLLEEWSQTHREQFQFVRVVGEQSAPRSFEVRDFLHRGGIPGVFYDVRSSEGQGLLRAVGQTGGPLPVCVLYNATILVNPTDIELGEAIGVNTHPEDRLYDLAIVGAGPAGLSAAVYAASEGLQTVVVERETPGGQAGTSSLVRNYLGFPRGISGGQLMRQAYRQAWLFQAQFVFGRDAAGLRAEGPLRVVTLNNGEEIRSRAVLLAVGVAYRKLGIPSVDALAGAGVYHSTAVSEAQAMVGKEVYVVGAGNSAGQAAVHLAKFAHRVHMVARSGSMAASMSDYLVQEIAATRNITVHLHTEVTDAVGDHVLEGLVLRDRLTGETRQEAAAALFILIGGDPYPSWLPPEVLRDPQGYVLSGDALAKNGWRREDWPLERAPLPLETSLPGVFVAGDAHHAAPKRIASAVGEGSAAVRYVHEYLATV